MTIDQCCRRQQAIADRIFMDFKYTKAGSDEQLRSLETLHLLISVWATYIINDEWLHSESFSLKVAAQSTLY
jgi:hypothetical protein